MDLRCRGLNIWDHGYKLFRTLLPALLGADGLGRPGFSFFFVCPFWTNPVLLVVVLLW